MTQLEGALMMVTSQSHSERLITQSVAVVVDAVADLFDIRSDLTAQVIAVAAVLDKSVGSLACEFSKVGVPKAVVIDIGVPHDPILGVIAIGIAVTVVVDAVTNLGPAWVGQYRAIVTIIRVVDVASGHLTPVMVVASEP